MRGEVLRADALLLPLPDASVDLIVTSPPYFALRSYRDAGEHYEGQVGSEATPQAFLEALWAVTAECQRVLKPSGSLFVNLGDKYSQRVATRVSSHQDGLYPDRPELRKDWKRDRALGLARMPRENVMPSGSAPREKSLMGLPWRYAIGCIDGKAGAPMVLRAEIVWSKPNGLPESVTDRVRRSHEQWFHLTREGRYFSAVDEVREEQASESKPRDKASERAGAKVMGTGQPGYSNGVRNWQHPLGKLPGSVWTIPSEPLTIPEWARVKYNLPDHFAAFPQEWPRRLILGWSPSGICIECGEGRRPVVDVVGEVLGRRGTRVAKIDGNEPEGNGRGINAAGSPMTRQSAGYACACPEPTAPTRPAVILDPFGGTGTVAMVAQRLGRIGVSVDLSMDYCRLARWRIHESGHGAKSTQRTYREAQGVLA